MTIELGNPHDRFFKEVWSRKAIGRDFLRHYLPRELVALLDLNSLELVKGSFVDPQLREYHSDLLYRLRRKDGGTALVHVLLEHKRNPERLTALQLLGYLLQIWRGIPKAEQDRGQLPPIIPVVVYHGDYPWSYGDTLQSALPFPVRLAPYQPDFRYVLCDLSHLDATAIQGKALLRATLLTMKYIGDEQLAARLPEIFGLLAVFGEQRTVLGYLETLLRYLATAATTVKPADVRQALTQVLPTLEERIMPTMAETWFEEGRAKGRAEGRAENIQSGEKRVLLRLLERRFGKVPKTYQTRIAAADADTLLFWSEQVLFAQRLADVFREPPTAGPESDN